MQRRAIESAQSWIMCEQGRKFFRRKALVDVFRCLEQTLDLGKVVAGQLSNFLRST